MAPLCIVLSLLGPQQGDALWRPTFKDPVPPLAWLAATWAKFEECGGGKRVIQGENATIASLVRPPKQKLLELSCQQH